MSCISANVAYLARLLHADVQLVAHVGDDVLANYALQPLRDLGIDLQHVRRVANTATAVAMIVGHPNAESSIVLANNANDAWTDSVMAAVWHGEPTSRNIFPPLAPNRVREHAARHC